MGFASDFAHRTLLGAFEEHVLDHVRNAGDPVVFVEISRFHVRINANKGYGLLLTNEYGQPVLEDDLRGLSLIFSKGVRFHDLCHLGK